MTKVIEILEASCSETNELPLFSSMVQAGFPSPADDYVDRKLDINKYLIKSPSSTYFVRVTGESMKNAGILNHDILVVDRSLKATSGKIVIAVLNGELTVKRLIKQANKILLAPENDDYKPIELLNESDLVIWGVVTAVIRKF